MADPTPPVPPADTTKPKASPLAGLVIPLLLILAAGVVFAVFYFLNQNIPTVNAAVLFDRYAAAAEKASKLADEYKDVDGDQVADTPADAKEPAELLFTEIPGPNPDADEVERGKPDPTPYRIALEALGLTGPEALAFEDSPSGVRASRGAGIPTVGVRSTHAPEELVAVGAILVVDDFAAEPLCALLARAGVAP